MTKLICHIGQPKTGTTALQNYLSANRHDMTKQGVLYPQSLYVKHCHHALLPLIFGAEGIPQHVAKRMGFEASKVLQNAQENYDELVRQIRQTNPSHVIISSESLSRTLTEPQAARFAAILSGMADEVMFVGYVRSPARRYMSRTQQRLKSYSLMIQPVPSAYSQIIDSYTAHFPQALHRTKIYERTRLVDGDTVSDFLAETGLSRPAREKTSRREPNATVSAEAMCLMQETGRQTLPRTRAEVSVQDKTNSVIRHADMVVAGYTRPQLNPEVADFIIRQDMDLLVLRDAHGLIFDDVDYTVVGKPLRGAIPPIQTVADICTVDQARLAQMRAYIAAPKLVRRWRMAGARLRDGIARWA